MDNNFQIQNIFIITPPAVVDNQLVLAPTTTEQLTIPSCDDIPTNVDHPPGISRSASPRTIGNFEVVSKCVCGAGSSSTSTTSTSRKPSGPESEQPPGETSATSDTENDSRVLSRDEPVLDAVPGDNTCVGSSQDSGIDEVGSTSSELEYEPMRVELEKGSDASPVPDNRKDESDAASEPHKQNEVGGTDQNEKEYEEQPHSLDACSDSSSLPDLSNISQNLSENANCLSNENEDQRTSKSSFVMSFNMDLEHGERKLESSNTLEKDCSNTPPDTPAPSLHMPSLFTTPEKSDEVGFSAVCLSISPFHIPVTTVPSPSSTVTTPVKVVPEDLLSDLERVSSKAPSFNKPAEKDTGLEDLASDTENSSTQSMVTESEGPAAGQSNSVTLVTSVYHSPIFSSGMEKEGPLSLLSIPLRKTRSTLRKISPAKGYKSPIKTSPMKQVSPILRKYHKYSPTKKNFGCKKKLSPILPKLTVRTAYFFFTFQVRKSRCTVYFAVNM